MTPSSRISSISGRALVLRANDVDTDRIMPARFLKAVSFEGLEQHVFEDDRAADASHPFNDPRYAGAAVLVVNKNFGCGSSREHAPQGLQRWGIRAIVGESFSEIFQGNAAMMGMPCVVADAMSIDAVQTLIEQDPTVTLAVDVATGVVRAGAIEIRASLPSAVRDAFLSGQWNPTAMLLDRFDEVRGVAEKLPYVSGF